MLNAALSLMEREQRSLDQGRHWSSSSQTYAPADVLLEYLADGWDISSVVGHEEYWYGGGRHVAVYYFELTKDNQALVLPILGNPIVRRLVRQRQLRIVRLTWGDVRLFEDAVSVA